MFQEAFVNSGTSRLMWSKHQEAFAVWSVMPCRVTRGYCGYWARCWGRAILCRSGGRLGDETDVGRVHGVVAVDAPIPPICSVSDEVVIVVIISMPNGHRLVTRT